MTCICCCLPTSTRLAFGFCFFTSTLLCGPSCICLFVCFFSHDGFLSWKCNLSFLCVVLLLFVWNFRRWQSLTFYQTIAAFVPGGRPLYVVDALTSISCLCCNPTCLPPPLIPSSAHAWKLHCIVRVDVCILSVFVSFLQPDSCISVDVLIIQNVTVWCLVFNVTVCYREFCLLVCCLLEMIILVHRIWNG